ncbi:hypothetical protein TIFTF001_014233 [Ficus carica]|uniref:Uncharacterized protein n=1 Tax=Ficus carica TaxID=3494 RepID=A0AA88A2D1_FICCA|nr:hypothetical protein TIFTF001_014233 [Ficus carica]
MSSSAQRTSATESLDGAIRETDLSHATATRQRDGDSCNHAMMRIATSSRESLVLVRSKLRYGYQISSSIFVDAAQMAARLGNRSILVLHRRCSDGDFGRRKYLG